MPLPEGEEGKNIYQLSPEKDTQLQKALSVLEEELETRNPLPEEQQTLLLWVFLGAAAVVLLAGVSISGALLWRSRHRQ